MKPLFMCMIILLIFSTMACNQPDDAADIPEGNDTKTEEPAEYDKDISVDETDTQQLVEFNEDGIYFTFPSSLATQVNLKNVIGDPDCDFLPYPDHTMLIFENYIHLEAFTTPVLMLFSPAGYSEILEDAATQVSALEGYVSGKTDLENAEELPFLPVWNAAQHFHSNAEFLQFKNGSGLRYLTQYVQDMSPIINESLFYTFQGITGDGNFYISITMPVTHPDLPDRWEDFFEDNDGNIEAYGESYQVYLEEAIKMLDGTEDKEFTPSLQMLDDIVKSLMVE
jgi:hypothetical protein